MKKLLEESINEYFNKYKNDNNTIAIVITGSYSRNENDYLSDIDWVLIVDKKVDNSSGFKEQYNGIDFDCRIEEFNFLSHNDWYMDQYYAYLNCKIFYDRDCAFKNLQEKYKIKWNEYVKKLVAIRLVECSVFLKFPKTVSELVVKKTHYEKFISRNDYYSAFNCLNIIENQLIDLCYLANKMPVPDLKNKMRNIDKYSFSKLLKKCCKKSANGTIDSLNKTYINYRKILKKIIGIVNNNYHFDNNLKSYYYKYRGEVR